MAGKTSDRWLIIGTCAVMLYVYVLFWENYSSQTKLQQAAVTQVKEYARGVSSAIGYFISERRHDAHTLADAAPIVAFLAGHPEPGPAEQPGQAAVHSLLEQMRVRKFIGGEPIYQRLALFDNQGRLLVEDSDQRTPRPIPILPAAARYQPVSFDRASGAILVSAPVFSKGIRLGQVVAYLASNKLHTQLLPVREDIGASLFLLSEEYTPVLWSGPRPSPEAAGSLRKLLPPDLRATPVVSAEPGLWDRQMLLTRSEVAQTPFVLLIAAPLSWVQRDATPLMSMLFIASLPISGMILAVVFVRLRRRNAELRHSIEESARQRRVLEDEIERRHHVEDALRAEQRQLEARSTELRETAERLATQQSLMRSLVDAIPDLIALKDTEFRYLGCNKAFEDAFGLKEEAILGRTADNLFPSDVTTLLRDKDRQTLETGQSLRFETWMDLPGGRRALFDNLLTPFYGPDGNVIGVLGVTRDISDLRLAEEQLRLRANFDHLTGLPNRELLRERLAQSIRVARRDNCQVALLLIDLDFFKEVNDALGHAAGDQLLVDTAKRLSGTVRDSDTVARLGGDEFVVVLGQLPDGADVTRVCLKVLEALAEPFLLGEQMASIGASIGIAIFPDDASNADMLFRNADMAMYRAKEAGRNTFQFYEPAMTELAMRRHLLATDLRRAIQQSDFTLHYQPIIASDTAKLAGAEALLRWTGQDGSPIPPDEFIPLAEETGLIRELGDWVLARAMADNAAWRAQGLTITTSVNVSGRQIMRGLTIRHIAEMLDAHGLPPSALALEITESMLLEDKPQYSNWLKEARKLGLRLDIDDFGTGYSSLSYLKRFPVQRIKIDRVFVRDMADDPDDHALVDAALAMAHSLRLEVVAEGVEDEHTCSLLQALNCDYLQGYLFSRPMPAHEFLSRHLDQAQGEGQEREAEAAA